MKSPSDASPRESVTRGTPPNNAGFIRQHSLGRWCRFTFIREKSQETAALSCDRGASGRTFADAGGTPALHNHLSFSVRHRIHQSHISRLLL